MSKVLKACLCGLLIAVSTMGAAQAENNAFFTDLNGEPRKLEDYTGNGRWQVVMIWASDCHVCNREAASYAEFHESQGDDGVGVIGISMDGEQNKTAALAFVERHDLVFPNLIGEPGVVGLYYAALTKESLRGTPTFLIFDPSGELAAAQAGTVSPDAITRFIAKNSSAGS